MSEAVYLRQKPVRPLRIFFTFNKKVSDCPSPSFPNLLSSFVDAGPSASENAFWMYETMRRMHGGVMDE